jgi:hypothetical protein
MCLRAIFRRKSVEFELDEELRFHYQQQVEKLCEAGLPLDAARRKARLIIGGAEQVKEQCRDARGVRVLENVAQDVAAVVLSNALWKRRYAGDPGILGKTILLDSEKYAVVGILPAGFDYPSARAQVWLPVRHEVSELDMRNRGNHRFLVVARLKDGISVEQASGALNGLQQRLRLEFPDELMGKGAQVSPLSENLVREVKQPLYVLMGAVLCVLLIACLNVANLLMARVTARRKEIALRAALGGSRWRIIQEQVSESLLLTFAGGVSGALLAWTTLDWLVSLQENLPRANTIHVDGVALAFTFAISVFCGRGAPARTGGYAQRACRAAQGRDTFDGGRKRSGAPAEDAVDGGSGADRCAAGRRGFAAQGFPRAAVGQNGMRDRECADHGFYVAGCDVPDAAGNCSLSGAVALARRYPAGRAPGGHCQRASGRRALHGQHL